MCALCTDGGSSFAAVLFYGHELTLLIFEVLIFVLVDVAFHYFVLDAAVTFLVMEASCTFRFYLMHNLSCLTYIFLMFVIFFITYIALFGIPVISCL